MLCAGADSLAPLPISSKVWKTKFRTRSFYQWDRGIRLWAGCVLREGIHIHVHVHDIMKNPFPVHDSYWASGLCRPVQRRISNTQGEFSKSYLVLQYFRHNAHCTLRQAVVLANSDCQLEDQTAIETLKETLLSSLHDVINCVRCDHTSTCLLYIYCWLYITWPLSLTRSGNTKLRLEKLLLLLPCLRHVDTIIRMFWAKIKQVHVYRSKIIQ